jgi:predicted CopG family antitoxin
MYKTVTLRLKDDVYKIFAQMAKAENRSLSNLIETAALKNIRERQFVDDIELAEILSNDELLKRLKEGSSEARQSKGRFVE